jgi:hypothetical protein
MNYCKSLLIAGPSILYYRCINDQQMRQGTSGFFLMCSKFYPDMFRQVVVGVKFGTH